MISDKTVKEAKKIIRATIEISENLIPLPKEYTLIKSPLKRMNKNLSRILLDKLKYNTPEQPQITKEMSELQQNLERYFRMMEEVSNAI